MLNVPIIGTPEFISLYITNGNNEISTERRFQKCVSVAEFKTKLELITGCNHKRMTVQAIDEEENVLFMLDDDTLCLANYPLETGTRIHVIDPQAAKELAFDENDESREKYEMSYEEYLKRPDTIVAWMRKNKIGRFREIPPEEKQRIAEEKQRQLEEETNAINSMHLGDRCEVKIPNLPVRRGNVRYTGKLETKTGLWVGIEFDEPVGDSDGSFEGYRYFECIAKYGAFSKPQYVSVGDYPEFGLDELDEF